LGFVPNTTSRRRSAPESERRATFVIDEGRRIAEVVQCATSKSLRADRAMTALARLA
jgi:peroxiredoxin